MFYIYTRSIRVKSSDGEADMEHLSAYHYIITNDISESDFRHPETRIFSDLSKMRTHLKNQKVTLEDICFDYTPAIVLESKPYDAVPTSYFDSSTGHKENITYKPSIQTVTRTKLTKEEQDEILEVLKD